MGFDPITLALAKGEVENLKKDGGVGYADKRVLMEGVFEPNETGKIVTDITEVKAGDTVQVTWNGVEYTCVAFAYADGTYKAVCFGNPLGIDGENNGMPFLHIAVETTSPPARYFITEDTEPVTVKVALLISHPIEAKYLVKTINLDDYGIGQTITELFNAGGGLRNIGVTGTFWYDVGTKDVLRLELSLGGTMRILVDQCARLWNGEECRQIGFFLFLADEYGNACRIELAIFMVNADVNGDGSVIKKHTVVGMAVTSNDA